MPRTPVPVQLLCLALLAGAFAPRTAVAGSFQDQLRGGEDEPSSSELTLRPAELSLAPQPEQAQPEPVQPEKLDHTTEVKPAPPATIQFGKAGTSWVALGGGAASNAKNTDFNIFGSYGRFIADNVEVFGELGAWSYSQPGKDATGFNLSMVVRWHWIRFGRWTSFADVGIGVLAATRPIPTGGTAFDFTPRLGGGFTYQLNDEGVQLELGVRWAHVSNARISGNAENPGRDSMLLYAGIIFPF